MRLVCLLFALLSQAAVVATQRPPALTVSQVEQLLPDLPDERLAQEIRERGLVSAPTAADIDRIRNVGAGPSTIAALSALVVRSPLTILLVPAVEGVSVGAGGARTLTDSTGRAVLYGLPPGTYRLTTEKSPAYPRLEQTVTLARGGSQVRVQLQAAIGKLSVVTGVPDARLQIPQRGSWVLPVRDLSLPAGSYAIEVVAPNFVPWTENVEIAPGDTKLVMPDLVVDAAAMARFVAENSARLSSELSTALAGGRLENYRIKAQLLLDYSGETVFEFRSLHHHSSGFHEAKLGFTRSGLLYEPLAGTCTRVTELFPWSKVVKMESEHDGTSGALLKVEIATGRKLDKKDNLNFSVLGSFMAPETERKPLKAGRVILGTTVTTSSRVRSPVGAYETLSGLAWLASELQKRDRDPAAAQYASSPAGKFIRDGSNDVLELRSDGTFSLMQGGKRYAGVFSVAGDRITLSVTGGPSNVGRYTGDTMVDPANSTWRRAPK